MKKIFFTILFAFGFMLVGFASQNQIEQQENNKQANESPKKYDFSLFKFVAPEEEKRDSTKNKKKQIKQNNSKNETTYIYENASFFVFFS